MDKLRLPTELISETLGVTLEEVLEWKASKEVPEEYLEALLAIPNKSAVMPGGLFCMQFEDCPGFIALADINSPALGWGLVNLSSLDESVMSAISNSTHPKASLKRWLVEACNALANIDFVWKLSAVTAGARPTLKVSLPGCKTNTVNLSVSLGSIMHPTVTRARKAGTFWSELSMWMQNTIVSSQMADTAKDYQEILANADIKPEELLKKELVKLCSEWVDCHILGSQEEGVEIKPQPIFTTVAGVTYRGVVQLTPKTIGTVFKAIREEDEDLDILYTGQGLQISQCSIPDLQRSGLVSIVPECMGINSALIWLMPNYRKVVSELIRKIALPLSESMVIQELEEAMLTAICSLKNKTAVPEGLAAGISFTTDKRAGVAKINPLVFSMFNTERLHKAFKPFTLSMLAGQDVFWSMLYQSLVPTDRDRKMLLYLCGTGSSFKSTFISKLYRSMLELTIYMKDGKIRAKHNRDLSIPVLQLTSQGDIAGTENFGDDKNQFYVAKVVEEVKAFNIESKRFQGIKQQLGNNTIAIKRKFVNGTYQIPISQTVIMDSNFPPVRPEYEKKSIDRVGEAIIFSQSSLLAGDPRYRVSSSNDHLYFHKLLTEADYDEAKELTGKQRVDLEDIEKVYLPFVLFKSILSHGKRCYETLTGVSQNEPVHATIKQELIDRKRIAQCYFALTDISNIGSLNVRAVDSLPATTADTLLTYLLRASLEYGKDRTLTGDDLLQFVNWFKDQVKSTYDKDNRSGLSTVFLKLIYTNLLAQDKLSFFLGSGSERVQWAETGINEKELRGVGFAPWMKEILASEHKETEGLQKIRHLFIKDLRETYLNNVNRNNLNEVLLTNEEIGEVIDL